MSETDIRHKNKISNWFACLAFAQFAMLLLFGCDSRPVFGQKADSLYLVNEDAEYFYDLKRPEEKHFLPYVLSEISGLTYVKKNLLACVEDEGGRTYFYDLQKREIVHSIRFSNPGDFEGVEYVDGMLYVLESDGDLYSFPYTEAKEANSDKMENVLTRDNDTEGLGYDPTTGKLLIACKEEGDTKNNKVQGKAIYSWDIDQNELIEKERFAITQKDIDDFLEENKGQKYDKDKIKFEPSGIAYHPIQKVFYVLASVGKLLLVVDRNGQILYSYPIAPRVLNQPEGICFAPNGDLFISSEGEGDRGYILKFPMKKR